MWILTGLDAELKEDAVGAINPAETPCNSNRDCVSGICVTTILGFLQSNGYDLESQSVDGFSPKVCKPKFYDFNIDPWRRDRGFPLTSAENRGCPEAASPRVDLKEII